MASEFLLSSAIQRFYFTQFVSGTRSVADGVLNATTTVTSATATFTSSDVGAAISGGSIPGGATIASVTNGTTVVISAAATGSASGVSLTITRTNALAMALFQTAVNTDFASYFTTVPTLVSASTIGGTASSALFIANPNLVLTVPQGSYLGYNLGNWQVMPASSMSGSVFTPAAV